MCRVHSGLGDVAGSLVMSRNINTRMNVFPSSGTVLNLQDENGRQVVMNVEAVIVARNLATNPYT